MPADPVAGAHKVENNGVQAVTVDLEAAAVMMAVDSWVAAVQEGKLAAEKAR
jgi:hypothetical protein